MFSLRLPNIVAILSLSLFVHLDIANCLLKLPDNVRVDSVVMQLVPEDYVYFSIEEFIDRIDGSAHLMVKEFNMQTDNKQVSANSYYRIKESGPNLDKNPLFNSDGVVTYDRNAMRCREETTKGWKLRHLSSMLALLATAEGISTEPIEQDRTAIGPLSVLRMIYLNADLFEYKLTSFDDNRAGYVHFYTLNVPLNNGQVAVVSCLVPKLTNTNRNLTLDYHKLSEAALTVHPSTVAISILDIGDPRLHQLNAQELLDVVHENVRTIMISYLYILERSLSRHAGLRPGSSDYTNPFTLPTGIGCGVVSRHNMLYVKAKYFSGQFGALGAARSRYVAFDGESKHLRLDYVGEFKLIYEMRSKRLIYVADSISDDQTNDSPTLPGAYAADRIHCAQMFLVGGANQQQFQQQEFNDRLLTTSSAEDVIGVDEHVGLSYLGTIQLDDGLHCQVFEREIDASNIPLVVQLSLRISPPKAARLSLIYYFVDQLPVDHGQLNIDQVFEQKFAYQTMWLRRMELVALSSLSKYKILCSQLTFTEFAWSLETMAEEMRNGEAIMLHPVRKFDISECKSAHDQVKLEFVIKQLNSSDWSSSEPTSSGHWDERADLISSSDLSSKAESLEEGIMQILVRHRLLPRSQICQLELILPRQQREAANKLLLIRTNLVEPLEFKVEQTLVGWLSSLDSLAIERNGAFVLRGEKLARFECALTLATKLDRLQQYFMVYCPGEDCAYTQDIDKLNYTKNNPDSPMVDKKFACQIYAQKKLSDSAKISSSDRFVAGSLEKSLKDLQISVELDREKRLINSTSGQDQLTAEVGVFRGAISQVSATKALSSESLGALGRAGYCFTEKSQLIETKGGQEEARGDFRVLTLQLGQHHSLVHCQKACQLRPNCLTYSFHQTGRVCVLSNLQRDYITETRSNVRLDNLLESKECNLCSLNSIHLYNSISVQLITSPAALSSNSKKQYYYSRGNLNDCANLCHANELNSNSTSHCHQFVFFRLISVCALEDPDSHLIQAERAKLPLAGINQQPIDWFMNTIIGKTDWFASHHGHQFKRDYLQYFAVVQWTSIKLGQDEDQLSSQAFKLIASPILYDLSYDECLRECTLVDPYCYLVDYCFHAVNAVPTRYCSRFQVLDIGEPNWPGKQLLTSAEDSQMNQFVASIGTHANLSVSNYGCTHNYLSGDYLALKRRLVRAQRSNSGSFPELELLDEMARLDREKSENYLSSIGQFLSSNYSKFHRVSQSLGALVSALLVLAGILAGIGLGAYGPKWAATMRATGASSLIAPDWAFPLELIRGNWNRVVRRRSQRSGSLEQLDVELTDLN